MPLDAGADLPATCYSCLLQDWMNIMSLRESYRESESTLNRLSGLEVSGSRFEVVNQAGCVDYDRFYEEKALPENAGEGELQVLQFDGKGVPVIKREAAKLKSRLGKGEKHQKKKEAMVGVSYTVDRKERTPEEVAENLIYPDKVEQRKAEIKQQSRDIKEAPRAKNIRRLASLAKPKQTVVEEMAADSQKRNKANQRPLVILMDGARGLRELIIKVLAGLDFTGILDIIHVTEYLWKAGNALYGENTASGKKWVYHQLLAILQGRVGWVIGGMKQTLTKRKLKAAQRKALYSAIQYFENHRQWMKYDEYLKAGFPIGTGVVESTCGHTVKDRMEGSGRRWSIAGAESVLLLRSVYTSGDRELYWQEHIRFERERLYGDILKTGNICDDYYKNEEKKAA